MKIRTMTLVTAGGGGVNWVAGEGFQGGKYSEGVSRGIAERLPGLATSAGRLNER